MPSNCSARSASRSDTANSAVTCSSQIIERIGAVTFGSFSIPRWKPKMSAVSGPRLSPSRIHLLQQLLRRCFDCLVEPMELVIAMVRRHRAAHDSKALFLVQEDAADHDSG
jgi:hypothetical protein